MSVHRQMILALVLGVFTPYAAALSVGEQHTFVDGELSGITCTTVFADTPGSNVTYPYADIIQLGIDSGYIGEGAGCSGGVIGGSFNSINTCPNATNSVTCSDRTFTTDILLLCPSNECGAVDEYLMVYCEPVGDHCTELYLTFWVDSDGNPGAAGATPVPALSLDGSSGGSGGGGGGGAVGDPVLTDLQGHTFLSGQAPQTDFVLFQLAPRSWEDVRTGYSAQLEMTTSSSKGAENGYFVESLTFSQSGCGSVVFTSLDHETIVDGPECLLSKIAHGDEGEVVLMLEGGETSLLIAPHTYDKTGRKGPGFLNFHVVGANPRQSCLSGLLCDEKH